MKKPFLILLPAFMILASCGGAKSSSSVSSNKATSTSSSSSDSTSIEIPKVTPTLQITVAGITVSDENTVYIAGPTVGSGTTSSWGYSKCTLNGATYDYTFPETEADTAIEYKVYVDNATTFAWANPCTENGSNVSSFLTTVEGQSIYGVTCHFTTQPDTTKTVDLKVTITPQDSTGAALALNTGVYVWMWDSKDNGAVVLTDNTDGTWSTTVSGVPVGTDAFTVTAMLEATNDSSKITWSHKASNVDGYKYTIAATDTTLAIAAKFASQPASPSTGGVTVSIVLNVTAIDSGASPKAEWAGWSNCAMTQDTTDTAKWAVDISNVAAGTYDLFFYYWVGSTVESYLGSAYTSNAESGITKFSVTVADVAKTVTINSADFVTTHVGTMA